MKMILNEKQVTPSVLKHMDHMEDLLYYGKKGAEMMMDTIEDVFDYLRSNIPRHGSRLTSKWDGSPAVVCSSRFHGEKFVALKHSWDRGRRFHSNREIEEYYSDPDQSSLVDKLESLLKYVEMIDIPENEIWMGDFLFSRNDLESRTIEGENYITFRPNTVVYAIPESDPMAGTILRSDIGIVWHTKYTGNDYQNLKKSFDVDSSILNDVPSVFNMDARITLSNVVFSREESIMVGHKIDSLRGGIDALVNDANFNLMIENPRLVARMQKYKNEIIRNNEVETGDFFSPYNLRKTIMEEMDAHIRTLRTKSGIERSMARKEELERFLEDISSTIENFYKVQELCIEIKNLFVEKLESSMTIRSFYQSLTRGYIPCGGEGFVISDTDGNVAKLVTRIGFSLANWQEDTVKGWMTPNRMSSSTTPASKETF